MFSLALKDLSKHFSTYHFYVPSHFDPSEWALKWSGLLLGDGPYFGILRYGIRNFLPTRKPKLESYFDILRLTLSK